MRLSFQLMLGFVLLFSLAGWFVVHIFTNEVKPGIRSATEDTLVDMAQLLAPMAAEDLKSGSISDGRLAHAFSQLNQRPINALIDGHLKQQTTYRIYVTDAAGIVIYDSTGKDIGADYSRWNDVYLTLQGRYGARSSPENPAEPNNTVMYVAAPLYDRLKIIGSLTVAKPNVTLHPLIQRSEQKILQAGGVLLLLSFGIGLSLVWWLNHSVSSLIRYANRISQGELPAAPKLYSPELTRLGHALDSMRRQLDGKSYIEQYIHSLTHELKSPLAAIRGATEILNEHPPEAVAQKFHHNILQQSQRMQRLIDRMLQLARLEAGTEQNRTPHLMSGLLDKVMQSRQTIAERRGIQISKQLDHAPTMICDGLLIEQAIGNLIDNAIDFSSTGACITVRDHLTGSHYEIIIEDEGSGIPEYAMDKIFDRFYSLPRPDKPKSSGLGLSFSREVAHQHGGDLVIQHRQPHGVKAVFSLENA